MILGGIVLGALFVVFLAAMVAPHLGGRWVW